MFDRTDLVVAAVRGGFAGCRMLVVGDLMLDRYLIGEVARISPEAPVPVLRLDRSHESVGGAGNVALNLAGLGVRADVAGWTGDDTAGHMLRELLGAAGVRVHGVETVGSRPTTTKTRVLSQNQQIIRIDDERTEPRPDHERAAWDARVIELLDEGYDGIVLSDYAKGVIDAGLCQPLIAHARERGVPVLVDPKGLQYGKYRGATTVTPNEDELAAALGVQNKFDTLATAGEQLRREIGLDFVTLTRGEAGITLLSAEGVTQVPAAAREVFDVSGAGDTVIAALAAAVAVGLGPHDAAVLANLAAGIIVGKLGTVPVKQAELFAALGADEPQPLPPALKIMSLEALTETVDTWHAAGELVGFTNGCFDVLHAGHVHTLDWARRHCDRLVVGLNTDASVRALKGPDRPIMSEDARATVLAALSSVDAVLLFDEATPRNVIQAVRPDVLVKGADYSESEIVGAQEVRSRGGRVLRAPLLDGLSTTAVLDRVRDQLPR
ncbi:MAG TPA: D-glycero-beta-D-manno-heptose-7-phosphate kinase [Acidimicrobiia bacterium]|jgi:D-beta-D-heptose 7-phosphate kinase/D-beta-D-heptose 1-phosphate adenosyltransferase